ncbi:phytochelatin synthase family protein [Variovorax sp. J22P168]|uniref:phytochelatin synthase family protein n=1 Tax=Variovorax jilinensis TaxID=3053513 RepID=UPI0025762331|nr:phytochelatin synthase family protein [Variovorax sp. J22P168]MDM0013570.1 phytochelatin synthase family protein [Variovorax sp. J22P168]
MPTPTASLPPQVRRFALAALLAAGALLSGCANPPVRVAAAPAPDQLPVASARAEASPPLVPFASEEGLARLARSGAKADFAALANQFEAQYNGAFCGPTSAAIVLNTVNARAADLPRDRTRLRKDDVQFMPAGADPIVPRFTQDSVIDRSPKSRAQVLGEPVVIGGRQVRDFGYQLRQFDAMLRANGLATRMVVVDDARSEEAIRADLSANLARGGDYVIVNYRREAVGQKGGGHISPLGAYDAASDSFLVLDVNPAVAGWVWMPTATLIKGMRSFDTVENRGYVTVGAP